MRKTTQVSFSKLGMGLWWEDESGEYRAKLIRLRPSGVFSVTDGVSLFCQEEALPDYATKTYQTSLAQLVGIRAVPRMAVQGERL